MKTKIPLNFYILCIITIAVLIALRHEPVIKIIFYGLLVFFIIYIQFSRYACTVQLTGNELKIRYLLPWYKNITVTLNNVFEVDYEKGFYDLFSDKTIGGVFVFPKYCYDRIILRRNLQNGVDVVHINVNTRILEFNKLIGKIKTQIGNNGLA